MAERCVAARNDGIGVEYLTGAARVLCQINHLNHAPRHRVDQDSPPASRILRLGNHVPREKVLPVASRRGGDLRPRGGERELEEALVHPRATLPLWRVVRDSVVMVEDED